ncbi:MFS transporter [Rhizobiaceae bacterium BDR2-2]|uniref:MFS transporter n=2 Tax=Ectorhizobium quercum TaxID=2965071 RepID=A0AAE3SU83_9HYPH|nr:MFS transporter [Ectorhizobium quercum]MCX8998563.1 MFS transporter [Ectorhizobium quercum]
MNGAPLTRFIAASGLTNLADGIATIAWAWTASLITRDPLLIALVAIALRLPWAIFALPAGIMTDRTDRRKLILRMDVLRAAAFGVAALVLWAATPLPAPPETGLASPLAFAVLTLAALVVGAAEVFRDNAAQTMLPGLVPHARLEAANGRLWSVELTGNALVGPPLGAAMIALALSLPFAANTVFYATAALVVAGIAGNFQPGRTTERNWRAELAEGIAFLRDAPLLRLLAWLTGFWNLFFQMVMIALILHVQDNLGLSSAAYGLILAAGAVGGIAGGLLGERIVRLIGPGPAAQWMLLASVPAFIGIALAPGAVSLAIVLALFEFTGLVWNTVSVSTRQRMIPDHLLGRVNSVYRLLAWGMMPLGLLLSGLIVRGLDGMVPRETALVAPFWVAAAGILLVALAGWRALGVGFARHAGETEGP